MAVLAKKSILINGRLQEKTLRQHTLDVLSAFTALFGDEQKPKPFAEHWFRFFQIPDEDSMSFFQCTKAAVILHDVGKSNDHFQEAVKGGGSQSLRHEFLGGWLLGLESLRNLLESVNTADFQIIRASVMGHHLKLCRGIMETADWDRPHITLCPEGIQELFDLFASEFSLQVPSSSQIPSHISLGALSGDFDSIESDLELSFEGDTRRIRLLRAARTALILADAAGSGLARERDQTVFIPVKQWIGDAFNETRVLSGERIEDMIITPRIEQIEAGQKESFSFSTFQAESARLSDRALLLASCGSGKTLAAWKWGTGVASRRTINRFIFLYPTRATATEGFKDYVAWAPETDGALLHGTSAYELQDMFDNPDSRSNKDFLSNDRLFAVGFWQKRLFSATVDQFLGFMGHDYRSSCLLPLLAESALVFDEVHSFDARLFSALLGFLREFDVPVLCMTASLPPSRLEQLKECGLEIFPPDPASLPDLFEKASASRYTIRRCTREYAAEEAIRALGRGEKILWVVNTVKRCQTLAAELSSMVPEARIICYHSRFRLRDRQERHKELIAAFREDGPMIALTTQVCEMSLDLSAALLVSEFAPLTSLIQRMGRCNRKLELEKFGQVLLYPPEKELPYSKDEMANVEAFINDLDGKTVSQADLQQLLERFSPETQEMEKLLPFLADEGFAFSAGDGIRDIDGYIVPAILESDTGNYWSLRRKAQPVDGLILPAPFKSTEKGKGFPPYLRIAKADYSEKLGLLC